MSRAIGVLLGLAAVVLLLKWITLAAVILGLFALAGWSIRAVVRRYAEDRAAVSHGRHAAGARPAADTADTVPDAEQVVREWSPPAGWQPPEQRGSREP